jgi:hypothetical protein
MSYSSRECEDKTKQLQLANYPCFKERQVFGTFCTERCKIVHPVNWQNISFPIRFWGIAKINDSYVVCAVPPTLVMWELNLEITNTIFMILLFLLLNDLTSFSFCIHFSFWLWNRMAWPTWLRQSRLTWPPWRLSRKGWRDCCKNTDIMEYLIK